MSFSAPRVIAACVAVLCCDAGLAQGILAVPGAGPAFPPAMPGNMRPEVIQPAFQSANANSCSYVGSVSDCMNVWGFVYYDEQGRYEGEYITVSESYYDSAIGRSAWRDASLCRVSRGTVKVGKGGATISYTAIDPSTCMFLSGNSCSLGQGGSGYSCVLHLFSGTLTVEGNWQSPAYLRQSVSTDTTVYRTTGERKQEHCTKVEGADMQTGGFSLNGRSAVFGDPGSNGYNSYWDTQCTDVYR